jgi:hypothetical protein
MAPPSTLLSLPHLRMGLWHEDMASLTLLHPSQGHSVPSTENNSHYLSAFVLYLPFNVHASRAVKFLLIHSVHVAILIKHMN